MTGKELIVLTGEDVVDRLPVVNNLSCDQSNQGIMFITSIRVVWNSTTISDFNISMPYIQVHSPKFTLLPLTEMVHRSRTSNFASRDMDLHL